MIPHADLVEDLLDTAAGQGRRSWRLRDACARRSRLGAGPARCPNGSGCLCPGRRRFVEHVGLADGDVVELGNTLVHALATPGHAPAHNAYTVADRRRGSEEPWLVLTGDSLLVGDVGRPDLHVPGALERQARELHKSLARLLELDDGVVVYPAHYGGSVCGRGLSSNPFSSIGFERAHNPMLEVADAEEFTRLLLSSCRRFPRVTTRSSLRTGRAGSQRSADRAAAE